jgi:hypothetical protein
MFKPLLVLRYLLLMWKVLKMIKFVNTLEESIRRPGAPTKLISDKAKAILSKKVNYILWSLNISDWQSEPTINIRMLVKDTSRI